MKLKKILAVMLAAVTCLMCMSLGAFAANDEPTITLKKNSITMLLNTTYTLKYTVTDAEEGAKLTMSSSDKNVVTVGKGGVLTAKGVGTATVTVKIKDTDVSAKCKVKVRAAKTTDELAKSMGTGFTIHNNLDVYGASYSTDITEWETAWGMPAISAKLMSTIKKGGFGTVLLNIRWDEHMAENGDIDEKWLDRVQECVDYAYDRGMYVIIDSADCWVSLKDENAYRTKYKKLWSQLAERFADYDQRLIFQGMYNSTSWAVDQDGEKFPVSGRKIVNHLVSDFVKTVRAAGGNNATRFLIVEPSDTYESLSLPKDEYLLVAVKWFGFGGSKFNDSIKKDINDSLENAKKCFIDKGYPVIVPDFCNVDNKMSQSEYTKMAEYMREKADEYGVNVVIVDWSGKDILNRQTLKWKFTKVRDAIIG